MVGVALPESRVKKLLILPFLLCAPLAAQAPVGTWALANAPDIPAVIEAATASMNFVVRPIARARLRKTNSAYARINIQRTGTEFVIQYDDRQPQHMPIDGQPVSWKREDGETFLVSAHEEKDSLVQAYRAEDGERTNIFRMDPVSKALTLQVTVRSPKLPGPVSYAMTYQPGN
jgi:hypothetical protein